jgi:hypothetical protein
MTAIQYNYFVLCWRCIRKGQDLGQRHALIAAARITRKKVTSGRLDVAVPSEKQQSDIRICLEELPDAVLEIASIHAVSRASASK